MLQASRESVAYKLPPVDEQLDTKTPAEQEKKDMEQKPKKRVRKKRLVTPLRILYTVALSIIAVAMIHGEMQLMQLTRDISALETKLQVMDSEGVSLKSRQEQMLSAEYIEAYAQNVLGMVKMDTSNIEYVELSNPDKIEVSTVAGAARGIFRIFSSDTE